MERIVWFILFIIMMIHCLDGGCPRATFEFFNNTIKTSYNFIDSSVGNIGSLETCPYTGRPYVYLPCYPNSSWGDEPYFSTCLKPPDNKELTTMLNILSSSLSSSIDHPYVNMSIEEVAKLPIDTFYDVSHVLSYLNQETMTLKSTSHTASVVNIIDHLISNNQNTNNEVYSNIYSIANKLLSSKSTLQMQQAQKSNRSIVKLLSSLETFSQNLKSNQSDQTFIEHNLAVSIVNMPNNRTKPIVLLITAFIAYFNQTALETALTPFTNIQFGWHELEVSVLFAIAGIEITLVYVILHFVTKKIHDEAILLFAYIILSIACSIGVIILPFSEVGSDKYLPVFLLFVGLDIFALPLIAVTTTSLFTQQTHNDQQGIGQGIQRFVINVATIIGPLFAGSLLKATWLMISFMFIIVLIATLLVTLVYPSFSLSNNDELSALIPPENKK
ncbi:unnamed protein product [Rotaria sordida]|uniref:Major facilitator superfamily (MFS) profile domain-containing protein n=1 Tax=Rotaria sordida TaxID=392033 RepID=A0A818NP85_9BILA|nr:unnamed protein product [Rotaria sordida]